MVGVALMSKGCSRVTVLVVAAGALGLFAQLAVAQTSSTASTTSQVWASDKESQAKMMQLPKIQAVPQAPMLDTTKAAALMSSPPKALAVITSKASAVADVPQVAQTLQTKQEAPPQPIAPAGKDSPTTSSKVLQFPQ